MTVVTLTPDGSSGLPTLPDITGAATVHAALADSSDASYVSFDDDDDGVRLTFSDLSLPAGAVIIYFAVGLRDKYVSGSGVTPSIDVNAGTGHTPHAAPVLTWASFTDHVVAAYSATTVSDVSDSNIDGATVDLLGDFSNRDFDVAKLSLFVQYVAKPVVDVTAPGATVNNTNTPPVTWTDTLDLDGGGQNKYEVKIFSAAQYGAGGFDPATSTPTETSGVTFGANTSWTPGDPLPDATYRAYVRVAQQVKSADHWSDWDYAQFALTANAPGVPTIHVVAEDDDGRIWITLDDTLGATTHAFEVQRSIDAGSTWETLRTTDNGLITPTGGIGRAYDTEVGNGVTVTYRSRALNIITEFTTYSAWSASTGPTAWQSGSWWLKSPLHPDMNIPVEVDGMDPLEQEANQGIFAPLGRRLPIVVSDVRSGFRGTVRFVFDDENERADFDDLLDLLEPLLLQAPATDHWTDRYIMLGSLTRARGVDKAFVGWTVETLPWVEVDVPDGDIVDWPAFAS